MKKAIDDVRAWKKARIGPRKLRECLLFQESFAASAHLSIRNGTSRGKHETFEQRSILDSRFRTFYFFSEHCGILHFKRPAGRQQRRGVRHAWHGLSIRLVHPALPVSDSAGHLQYVRDRREYREVRPRHRRAVHAQLGRTGGAADPMGERQSIDRGTRGARFHRLDRIGARCADIECCCLLDEL